MIHSISLSCYQKDGRIYTILIWQNNYKRINSFLIVLTLYYLFKDETVCKTNSFIYASLFDDRTALQSHYINILIFFYFHVWINQYQDVMTGSMSRWYKKNIPLENMANQYIRYLDAKSSIWRIKVSKKRNSILVLKDYVRRITISRHKPFVVEENDIILQES